MEEINVGLLGCGIVGTGVAKLLLENRALLSARLGADIVLKKIADIDIETDRGLAVDDTVWTTNADEIIDDPDIAIVVEMIGGEGIAKELILKAIAKGKHIVTANKALLASYGNELIQAAGQQQVEIAFEASVGGCMPIIKTLRESLVGNHIKTMAGILNGTCNYILSKITQEGISFREALSQAQANGFAEADPTLDVEGYDTAHKLAILASLAYGMHINLKDIYIEGISSITPMDIEFAKQFGYTIKLLAISKFSANNVEARVHPVMIPSENILSNVSGSLNAISVVGDAIGNMLICGHGAGMMPTGSAVIGDIVDISRNILSGGSAMRVPPLSYQAGNIKTIPILPIEEISSRYYIRFRTIDRPGVLAKIAGILGQNDISIKSVHQKGRDPHGAVPIVMLTHFAREADIQRALKAISELDINNEKPILIRIEDNIKNND